MSREEIRQLFESGANALNQAKSSSDPRDHGDLIVEARRCLDQAIDMTERDNPNFGSFVHTWASAHALSIAFVDYSAELDLYLAASPLVERLNSWFQENHGRAAHKFDLKEEVLEDFWAGIVQIQDERYSSLDIPDLISPGALAASVDALGEAILHSGHSTTRVWNLCRSVALYLRMDLYNPSEISLCISSFTKATTFSDTRGDSSFPPVDEIDPSLSKITEKMLHNSQNKFRYRSLRNIAVFYAER
jgi:hypothetical protein